MSGKSTFRILYANLNDEKTLSKEEVDNFTRIDFKRSGYGYLDPNEAEKRFQENGVPPFVEFVKEVAEKYNDHEYKHYEPIADPLPIWIDTSTGRRYYETADYEFCSDFRELYEYYSLTGAGRGSCVEISREEVRDMLQVIDYIFLGKYDKDFERLFFSDNRFIEILDSVYPKFMWRFRKTHKKEDAEKTVIILKEKGKTYSNYDDEEDDLCDEDEEDYGDAESDWVSEGRGTLEYLKMVLENFIHLANSYKYSDESYGGKKADLKLVYFLSI